MSTAITFARASVARYIRAERRTCLPAEIVMNRAVNFADRMATAKAKDGQAELSDAYAAVTSWLGASRDRLNARRAPAVLEPLTRPFEPGNPVLVDSGREGRVTSVHDGYVWVSVKDPMVNTGWRPANGYDPADVQHARPYQVGDDIRVTRRSQDDLSGLWTITGLHVVSDTGNYVADLIATGGTLHGVVILNPERTAAHRDGYTIELLAHEHAETASLDDTTPALVQLDPDDVGHRVIAAALAFDELDDRREGLDVAGVDAWDTAREGLRQALADFRKAAAR